MKYPVSNYSTDFSDSTMLIFFRSRHADTAFSIPAKAFIGNNRHPASSCFQSISSEIFSVSLTWLPCGCE